MLQLFKSEKKIITEIHNEFDTAEDRLLQAADKLFNELNLKTQEGVQQKAERLRRIGFTNSPLVKQHSEINESLGISKEQADLIRYYKQEYPFLKFLTEIELNKICKKYNLVYKPIENFIGDVPDKSITEIENAKQRKEEDSPENKKWCVLERDGSFCMTSGDGGSWCGIWGSEWYKIPSIIEGKNFNSHFDASSYLRRTMGFTTEYLVKKATNYEQDRQGLFICAPKSLFVGKDNSISIFEVKDPIVFRFVRGGVQVISKWGLEASDESLVNEINN